MSIRSLGLFYLLRSELASNLELCDDGLVGTASSPSNLEPSTLGALPQTAEGASMSDSMLTEPVVVLDLPDRLVLHKPPGWEVDIGRGVWRSPLRDRPLLSKFCQSLLPKRRAPVCHADEFGCGVVHRLDVPSSGLILTGVNFEGLYSIRCQLNSHQVHREYFIVCHGEVPTTLECVDARIDIRSTLTNEAATVCPFGKPARTYVKAVAHSPWRGRGACPTSVTAVRIYTGRRHQIRVHLQSRGHAPASDGRYPLLELSCLFPAIYEHAPGGAPESRASTG
mmetsp:Transcript_35124/g.81548  ORF Transcript_35124/g.81548 Transcript_35124/m.81548 type:complete len:281 (+) Transcript_35124:76-918(+)